MKLNKMKKEDLIEEIQRLQKKNARLEKIKSGKGSKRTSQKKTTKQVKISESNLDALINNSPGTIWSLDKNLNFTNFNDLFKHDYKKAYNIELKKGLNAIEILDAELREFWISKYSAALSGEKICFEFSARIDEQVRYFDVSLNPIFHNNKISGISALSIDVTEHKLGEQLIFDNQVKLQNIISNSPIVLFMIDKNGVFTLSEGKGLEALGLKPGEVVGLSALEMYKDFPQIVNSIKQALNGEINTAIHNMGNLIFDVSYSPIKNNDSEIIGVIGVANDITKRWKAEAESSQLLKIIDESLNEIYLFDAETLKFDYVNEGAKKNLGYSDEEIRSLTPLDIKPEFTLETFKTLINPLLTKEKKKLIFETTHKRFNASTYPVEIHLHLVRRADKQQFLAVINDITERKKSESELVKRQGLITATLLSIGEALISTDNTGNITMMNPVAENLTGWKLSECSGKNINEIFNIVNAKSGEKADNPIDRTLKEGVIVGLANHTKLINKEGIEYQIADSCAPIKDESGQILGAVLVFRDVTKDYERREKLIISDEIIKNSINGIALSDLSGKLNLINDSFIKMWGYSHQSEILGRNADEFWNNPEDARIVIQRLLNEGFYTTELKAKKANGTLFDVLLTANFVSDSEGNPLALSGSFIDITERKIAEEQLRTSEEKYRLLFESNPHPMWVYDLETFAFLTVNDSAIAKYGYSKDEFMKMTIKQIRPEEDIDRLIDNVKNVISGLDDAGIWKHRKKDGSTIFVEIVSHTLNFEGRKAEMVLAHDVTERILAEQNLEDSRARLSLALSSTNQGIYDLDIQTGAAMVTPEYATMLGYDPASFEESNENWIERLHPEDREFTAKAYLDYIEGKTKEYRVEFRQRTADNNWKWILSLGKIVEFDQNGKPVRMLGTHTDITKQKNAENDILRLSRAVQQSPVTVEITDTDGRIEYVNPKFSEVTGYTFEEVIGKNPKFLKSGYTTGDEYKIMWETITSGKEWKGEFYNKKKNGELFWESAMITPIFNSKGEITNYLAIKQDITKQKEMTTELIEAKEKAEEMNRIKAYFFANMSHELRTPFVGIMGFSEILSESLQNPEQKKMAEQILKSSKRLTDTLNKILNVTRLEFDKLDVKLTSVNVVEIISQTAVLFSKSAALQNTVINTEFNPNSIVINSDAKLLDEIISNLINNAIKFTTNGIIEIKAQLKSNKDKKTLLLSVIDNGIGIPQEKQKLIWEEFRQVSEGLNRSFEGTGLGLTLTKKYVTTLGGTIKLESEVGKGSAFIIEIPVVESSEVKLSPKEQIEDYKVKQNFIPSQLKVLYVEDDIIALNYVNIVLKSLCKIDTAFNASIAYEKISTEKYDAILMDINLGKDIDGVELMKKIRNVKGYENLPMVAVTAYADVKDKEEFLAQGFTHYLSKPFTSNELKSMIMRIFK